MVPIPTVLQRLLTGCLLLMGVACSTPDAKDVPDPGSASTDALPSFTPLLENREDLQSWQAIDTDGQAFSIDSNGVLEVRGERGWLRSPRLYADFVLRFQFRFQTPDADSGLFLRVAEDGPDFMRGWPGGAYQVQIRDISVNPGDRPLPLAHVYRHVIAEGETDYQRDRVFELYGGVGTWQDYEITVIGDLLTVRLNGETVTTARDIINRTGHIGFQSEAGVVQYRHLEIHEL